MRKIYAALLSLFLIVFIDTHLNGQAVGTYVFTPSSGTYTPLSGATASTATGDDGTQNVAIGFNFDFGGVTYTNAVMSTNGALKLGANSSTTFPTSWTNNLSNTYNAAIIAPMWDDNNATGGSVSYLLSGTAPNRTFSVEWTNIHMGGVGSTSTPTATFQLTLTETTNTITFVYGTINTLTSSTISIGLNDLTSFLSVTPGTPATSSSATANNGISSAASIPSGTTYLFFPPPPCVAPPGGGTTQSSATTACPGVSFTLSVSGSSFGTGLTYEWEWSSDNVTWNTFTPAQTGQTLTTSITTPTYFHRKITCSAQDGYSSSLLVNVTAPLTTPFTEDFATYATTFPPGCWSRNNATYLFGQAVSSYGVGVGSAKFDFYNASSGTNLDLATPLFAPVPANYRVTFDHAYATFTTQVDQLQVLYSTDGGLTYTNLATYLGGAAGPLNTIGGSGATTSVFSPTASQWASKSIALPVGTNKLIFRGVSGFGNNLFIDKITVEPIPPCLAPTNLTAAGSGPTTATLNWTASASNPSNGYQWEVRSSGAAGSGATGLDASGSVGAGITTANATGLTANTTYSAYVRSDCGSGTFSGWTLAYTFTTPCNPIAIPFTEAFTTYATTFPPMCWSRNSASFLIGDAASAYGVNLGSAKFDFYDASSGTNLDLESPLFTPVPANHRLVFDHAYATFFGEVDQLQIFYSTDGGVTYTNLVTYLGGSGGPLNTGGGVLPAFTPAASQWAEKAVDLPVGTNRLKFRGVSAFGNNLFLDNITVEPTPTCLPVSNIGVVAVSPTSLIVSFTPPATTPTVGYIVEVGPPGFTPGTDNTPGTGGAVTFGAGSPITVNGLTANTAYDVYVRKICIAGADFSTNKKSSGTTLCNATNIPYVQNFESAAVPGMPTCTSMQDVNGNSGSFWAGTGAGGWETYTDANPLTYVSPSKALLYYYDFNNLSRPADDWFYTQGLNLTAGTTYRLKFFYKALDGANYPEKLEVKYGTMAYASAMTTSLFVNNNISSAYANPYDSVRVDFTPTSTGVYYLGFHAFSDPDEFGILLDDISVKLAPVVDMGVSALVLPNLNCPTSGVFVQATIKNYNLSAIDFATYPITVNAAISGAASGTLSTTINAGTLAPNATMNVYLSPSFNFTTAGTYNITAYTSSTFDTENANDTTKTSVNVNPSPAAPVITPSAPQLCIGGQTQLSTQYTAPPPAPVTLPAVSSGTISLTVPDGSAAGITNSLSVNSVPLGATITGISVNMNLTHTWISDMAVNLKAPNGNILNLFNRNGGSGDNLTNTTVSSTGTAAFSGSAPPYTGTYAPDAANGVGPTGYESNVTSFSGLYSQPNGAWTLVLRDYVGFDVGTLTSWSITITYQMLNPVVTWTPVTDLFTNAGATTAYTAGTDAPSVYSKPSAVGAITYVATATTSAGCTASKSVVVTVNPIPTVTVGSIPDTVCLSDPNIALTGTPAGGSWSGVGVSGANFLPPATAVGTYALTYSYTSAAGCTGTAVKSIAVKECPERIVRLSDNAVILYPNPNNGQFNIRINSVLYNYLTMKVYTNAGVLIRTQQLTGLAWGRVVPIDLTNLPGGLYMIKFYYDGGVRTNEKTFKVLIGTP